VFVFFVLDLSVFSPFLPPSLCLLNIIVEKNPLSDDEVDEGILANEVLLTLFTRGPGPSVSFPASWAISDRRRIVGRRRENRIGATQLQLKYEEVKKNRFN
jgi:hypothetical protein